MSVGLGLAAAVAFQMMRSPDASAAGDWLARQLEARRGTAETSVVEASSLDPALLRRWRSQADELTVASVALDETSHERWLPRLERLESALVDPATPENVRLELAWIEARLLETGVIGPPEG